MSISDAFNRVFSMGQGMNSSLGNSAANSNINGPIQTAQDAYNTAVMNQLMQQHRASQSLSGWNNPGAIYETQKYKRASGKLIRPIAVGNRDNSLHVVRFMLGRVPNDACVVDADCYLDIDDLPDSYKEPVMMLKTGMPQDMQVDDFFDLQGVGRVRLIEPGLHYFSIFTIGTL